MIKNKKLLYGKYYLKKTKKKIKNKIKKLLIKNKRIPKIIIINIGNNKNSNLYINIKKKIFQYTGIKYKIININNNIKEKRIIKFIKFININKKIDCILIQLPINKKFNTNKLINNINPNKDVDGLHSNNIGKLCQGKPWIRPCASYGVIKLLQNYKIKLKGTNALIIGSSNLIGKPMLMELLNKGSTVSIVNSKTKKIKKYIKNTTLLISAIGKYNLYPIQWIKKNSIVIDIGININKKNIIKGDINYKKIIKKIKYITPTPGGTGPMTISILLKNIIKIYKKLN